MAYDLQIGAATLWMEARGEPEEGRIAVAHVIVNRLRAKRFGETVSEVCLRFRQFSAWNDESPNVKRFDRQNIIQFARAPDAELDKYAVYLKDALSGKTKDPTNGAQFYVNQHIADPTWDDKFVKTAQIGQHTFFRDR